MLRFRAVTVLLLVAWMARPDTVRALPVIPPDFIQETRASGLSGPVNFDFLPDGRVLVVERVTGRIRLMRLSGAPADTVGAVGDLRIGTIEQGLLGIAVDPLWPLKPYVYVHYTAASTYNVKVVRYALTGDLDGTGNGRLALDPASRREILPDLPDDSSLHNGGTLLFGPDRKLYVALGDDGVSCSAQDIHQLRGKILRLDVRGIPDGGGPAPSYFTLDPRNNPFHEDADPRARLVWQYGLRNPWSFDFDPASKAVAIADVGEATWEEIDVTVYAGRNFGWPFFEANAPFRFDCDAPDFTNLTGPSYKYGRDSTGAATVILGGVCYHPPLLTTGFPQEYWGQVFFLDFPSGRLSRLTCTDGTCVISDPVPGQPNAFTWGEGFSFVPRMRFGPDAALWYLQGTELRRIHHPGTIGVPNPTAGVDIAIDAFPVPAAGTVRLAYRTPGASRPALFISDARGRRVRTFPAGAAADGGQGAIAWDGSDDAGRRVAAGVYFACVRVGNVSAARRLVLLGTR